MASIVVSELWVYPIKACQGVKQETLNVGPTGVWLDRAWCVVDVSGNRQAKNEAISQRRLPKLASIHVEIDQAQNVLRIAAPDCQPLTVPINEADYAHNEDVVVECGGMSTTSDGGWSLGFHQGKSAGPAAEKWFTEYLNNAVISDLPAGRYVLVRSLSANVRKLDRYLGARQAPFSNSMSAQRNGEGSPFKLQRMAVRADDAIRFQDMAPVHVASQSSLDELTQRMGVDSYPVQCFRPNVVVNGAPAWQEELWDRFTIGSTSFRGWKPTPRCTVPTRNPVTGDFQLPKQKMLATLTLRKYWPEKCVDEEWGQEWQGPVFGVNVGCDGGGSLRVGDRVAITQFYPGKSTFSIVPLLIFSTLMLAYVLKN